jgi:serine/threonine protein kinase
MLKEGSIFNNFMLTKLVSRTPTGELYQSIHVESGERYLIKLASTEWQMVLDDAPLRGFEFVPGSARSWQPLPADVLKKETEFLRGVADQQVGLLKPVLHDEADGTVYTAYEFFDGATLLSHIQTRSKFNTFAISNICRQVSKLHAAGLFHGNLRPSSMLIAEDTVILLEPTMPMVEYNPEDKNRIDRCLTCPEYYPFLDPRHDSMALGMLLYYFFTQKHPTMALPTIPGTTVRRRPERKLQAFLDEARELGAARFFSPLLSYLNPSQFRRAVTPETEELVAKTIGLQREYIGEPDEQVAIVEGSWLDMWIDPMSVSPEKLWTLDKTANVFDHIVEERMKERGQRPSANSQSEIERAS